MFKKNKTFNYKIKKILKGSFINRVHKSLKVTENIVCVLSDPAAVRHTSGKCEFWNRSQRKEEWSPTSALSCDSVALSLTDYTLDTGKEKRR